MVEELKETPNLNAATRILISENFLLMDQNEKDRFLF